MKRFWQGRGMRKFRKSRAAVVSSLVIGVYLFSALLLLALDPLRVSSTEASTSERVGAATMPGFFLASRPEKRLQDAEFYLGTIDRDLRRATNPEKAVAERQFGERRLRAFPLDELESRIAEGLALYDELAVTPDLNEAEELWPRLELLEASVGDLFEPLAGWDAVAYKLRLSLGTDRQGRSISVRALYSIKVAVQIGLITSLISVLFGSLLGAAAGYFGGWVDMLVIWLYSTFSAIPYLVSAGARRLPLPGWTLRQHARTGLRRLLHDLLDRDLQGRSRRDAEAQGARVRAGREPPSASAVSTSSSSTCIAEYGAPDVHQLLPDLHRRDQVRGDPELPRPRREAGLFLGHHDQPVASRRSSTASSGRSARRRRSWSAWFSPSTSSPTPCRTPSIPSTFRADGCQRRTRPPGAPPDHELPHRCGGRHRRGRRHLRRLHAARRWASSASRAAGRP